MQPHAKLVHNNIPSFENPTLSAFPPDSHRDRSYDTSLSHSSSLKSNSGKLLAIKIEQETGQRTTRWKHLARGEFKASVGKSVLVIGGKRHSEDSYITVTGEMKKCKVTPNASYNQPVMTLHSLLVTERMAVLCGISLAEDAGLGPAIIETDSKVKDKVEETTHIERARDPSAEYLRPAHVPSLSSNLWKKELVDTIQQQPWIGDRRSTSRKINVDTRVLVLDLYYLIFRLGQFRGGRPRTRD
ncbi:hypothetical protein ACOSQ3_007043 [Xanthoceras sorbifolium]